MAALDDSNGFYRHNPTSDDKAHILVFVVAVDINDVADKSMFKKMTEIRLAARDLGKMKCSMVVQKCFSSDGQYKCILAVIHLLNQLPIKDAKQYKDCFKV